jgi:ribosomal protein S3AE
MTKRKKFHEIELPVINKKIELLAVSKEDLKGRTVKLDLTREVRGKSFEIIFKILDKKIQPYRLHVYPYFIRRMMRKSVDYVEDSFIVKSKDGELRVKPFLIARKKVSRKVRKALREECKKELTKMIENKKFSTILSSLIKNDLQKELSLKLKKIYPLSLCEIRDIYLE